MGNKMESILELDILAKIFFCYFSLYVQMDSPGTMGGGRGWGVVIDGWNELVYFECSHSSASDQ